VIGVQALLISRSVCRSRILAGNPKFCGVMTSEYAWEAVLLALSWTWSVKL
jgi:hypothetical protein